MCVCPCVEIENHTTKKKKNQVKYFVSFTDVLPTSTLHVQSSTGVQPFWSYRRVSLQVLVMALTAWGEIYLRLGGRCRDPLEVRLCGVGLRDLMRGKCGSCLIC